MAEFPVAGTFLPDADDNPDMGAKFEAWLAADKQLPGARASATLTIAGGAISPDRYDVVVDTEGAVASDFLDSMGGTLPVGSLVRLHVADTARKITVRHGQGGAGVQFFLDTNQMSLSHADSWIMLYRSSVGWHEVQRHYAPSAAAALWREYHGLSTAATYPVAIQSEAEAGASNVLLTTVLRVAQMMATATLAILNRAALPSALLPTDQLLVARGGVLYRATGAQLPGTPFDTGELPVTNGYAFFEPHGLGARPSRIETWLVCKADQHGYGADVDWIGDPDPTKVEVWHTPTHLGYARTGAAIEVVPSGGGGRQSIDPAKWAIRIRAYR